MERRSTFLCFFPGVGEDDKREDGDVLAAILANDPINEDEVPLIGIPLSDSVDPPTTGNISVSSNRNPVPSVWDGIMVPVKHSAWILMDS